MFSFLIEGIRDVFKEWVGILPFKSELDRFNAIPQDSFPGNLRRETGSEIALNARNFVLPSVTSKVRRVC